MELALPLEVWRCVECLADLRGQENVSTMIGVPYDGEGPAPSYYVAFCDPECGNYWMEQNQVQWSRNVTEGDQDS